MKIFLIVLTLVLLNGTTGWYIEPEQIAPIAFAERPKKSLPAFRSEAELNSFFRKIRRQRHSSGGGGGGGTGYGSGSAPAAGEALQTVSVTAAVASNAESVTNVQHAGVDEGGIVKLRGDHLVILRRGRLFTVSIPSDTLRPISSINAFGPDMNPDESWYDEMLISDDTIAVIGYSYERGGTEVGIFNIDDKGNLRYRSTYHLRSNDYYSSRNYASRLIGNKLIFYSPLDLSFDDVNIAQSLPAVRKWRKGVKQGDFKRIIPATSIYRGQRDFEIDDDVALHTVTTCDLSGGEMSCGATSVLGPSGNVFYVSPGSVYVWASQWGEGSARPMLYRMPLDGSAPTALSVSGSPVDQFSFLESDDGHLNVLVRSESKGDGMWAAETAEGDVALMRVALSSFSDGQTPVAKSQYRQLPIPNGYTFQNRFVGEHILYGTGSGWGKPDRTGNASLYIAKWNGGGRVSALPLPHGIDRIELLGAGLIVIGTDGRNLHFTSVRLGGEPAIADSFALQGSSQGELRSHGFFYKSDGGDSGIVGLPVRGLGRPGYEHLSLESASILFLDNRSLRLQRIGELKSQPEKAADDGCQASCVDWYGNSRPLFVRGRIFALLGYEIVEGRINGDGIGEVGRTNFAPHQRRAEGR